MAELYRMLPDGSVEAVEDLMEWGKVMQKENRLVAKVQSGDVRISTVFLGLNHQFGEGPPLLFETMVFGGKHDQECERYSTRDEALAGHCKMATKVLGPHWNA